MRFLLVSGLLCAATAAAAQQPGRYTLRGEAAIYNLAGRVRIQGGTTAEGIHVGAMAGTVDLLQRCYAGVELRAGQLWFNPSLPDELEQLRFQLRYRQHSLLVEISKQALAITSQPAAPTPITVCVKGDVREIRPGEHVEFVLPPRPGEDGRAVR